MKRILTILLTIILTSGAAFAQGDGIAAERIHAAKIAYITDRIKLTTAQSGEFIPLFNEYEKEVKVVRQSFKQKYRKDHPDADAATLVQYVMDDLDFQEQNLTIKRRYQDRFLKIITQQQLTELNMAEREFKQILVKRLKGEWREGGGKRFR